MSNLKHWIWLSQRKGVAGQAAVKVLEYFGTPEQVHTADRGAFELMGGLNERAIRSLMDKSLDEADRILGDCDRLGIRLLTRNGWRPSTSRLWCSTGRAGRSHLMRKSPLLS